MKRNRRFMERIWDAKTGNFHKHGPGVYVYGHRYWGYVEGCQCDDVTETKETTYSPHFAVGKKDDGPIDGTWFKSAIDIARKKISDGAEKMTLSGNRVLLRDKHSLVIVMAGHKFSGEYSIEMNVLDIVYPFLTKGSKVYLSFGAHGGLFVDDVMAIHCALMPEIPKGYEKMISTQKNARGFFRIEDPDALIKAIPSKWTAVDAHDGMVYFDDAPAVKCVGEFSKTKIDGRLVKKALCDHGEAVTFAGPKEKAAPITIRVSREKIVLLAVVWP